MPTHADRTLDDDLEAQHAEHPEEVPASELELRANSDIAAEAERVRSQRGDLVAEEALDDEALARQVSRSPGDALPYRELMERRFGVDLGDVVAHTGPEAIAATRRMGVAAFTLGNHIAFRETDPSQEIVAHEVTHALQQTGRGAGARNADEAEAEQVEGKVARGEDLSMHALAASTEASTGGGEAVRAKNLEREEVDAEELSQLGEDEALDAARVAKAIAFNDKKFSGGQRDQLRGFLGGAEVEAGGGFSSADIHAIARLQLGAGVAADKVDGMIGDTTMAIVLHSGFAFQFDEKMKAKASDVRLVFYPGEFEDLGAWKTTIDAAKQAAADAGDPSMAYRYLENVPDGTGRIYVKHKGNIVAKMDARGGPPFKIQDGTHTADPSRAGTYALGATAPHRTDNWTMSQIRWGAKLRETGDGEVEFQDPGSSKWKVATGDNPDIKEAIPKGEFYEGGVLAKEWTKNDFGKVSWRIQNSPGLFIHTTPTDEHNLLSTDDMSYSHGCLHIDPVERDEMMARGFLQGGVTLEIKKYDVHLVPEPMREMMTGDEEVES
jgi:hypothetical protein